MKQADDTRLRIGIEHPPTDTISIPTRRGANRAVDLLREFRERGAVVAGHDALLSDAGVRELGFEPAPQPLTGYDVAVVHANHRAYAALDWGSVAPLIVDARNALDRAAVEATGARYLGVGRPISRA